MRTGCYLEVMETPVAAPQARDAGGSAARAQPAVQQPALGRAGRPLEVADLLSGLVADGLVLPETAATLSRDASLSTADRHPLVVIADRKLKSAALPHGALDLEALCQWLAGRLKMEYRHIDPLRVDFSRIGDVMSGTYASRFRILPLEVGAGEVVIATAQPFVTEWANELSHTLRKEVRTVLANPLELQRIGGRYALVTMCIGGGPGIAAIFARA